MILKSHAGWFLTLLQAPLCDNFGLYRREILYSHFRGNSNSSVKMKTGLLVRIFNYNMVISLSLTAIEHLYAELRQTNICGVTRRLFIGIVKARCSCCLLDNNFRIFWRSLCLFACFDRKVSAFFCTLFLQVNLRLSRSSVADVWLHACKIH